MLYDVSNRIKMKFSLPNIACRTIANKRFSWITGNFIIATKTKRQSKDTNDLWKRVN